MATARDICTGALRLIGATAIDEDPTPGDAAVALAALNGIMGAYASDGWAEEWTPLALGDAWPLSAALVEPLKAHLAVNVAPNFMREAPRTVRANALRFGAMLAAAAVRPQTFGRGLAAEPPWRW